MKLHVFGFLQQRKALPPILKLYRKWINMVHMSFKRFYLRITPPEDSLALMCQQTCVLAFCAHSELLYPSILLPAEQSGLPWPIAAQQPLEESAKTVPQLIPFYKICLIFPFKGWVHLHNPWMFLLTAFGELKRGWKPNLNGPPLLLAIQFNIFQTPTVNMKRSLSLEDFQKRWPATKVVHSWNMQAEVL